MKPVIFLLFLLEVVYGDTTKTRWDLTTIGTPIKLTTEGDHSFPVLSYNARYIYFTAKGGKYGSDCEHVYQMDLFNLDINNPQPKISLYSTGIGSETRTVPYSVDIYSSTYSVVSTFFDAIKKLNDTTLGNLDKDLFCKEESLCKSPADGSELKEVCNSHFFTEHKKGKEVLMRFEKYGDSEIYSTERAADKNGWMNQMVSNPSGEDTVFSQNCENGECVEYWYYDNETPVAVTTLQDGVYDGFSAKKQALVFHGKKGKPKAAGTGVVPLTGSQIFGATFRDMKTNKEAAQFEPNTMKPKSYIYPQIFESNREEFIYLATGHDPVTNKSNLYLFEMLTSIPEQNNKQKVAEYRLTGDSDINKDSNSLHSFVDPSQRYIVFVSDRDTPGSNQLYLGKVIVDHQLNPSFPPKFYPIAPHNYGLWSSTIKQVYTYTYPFTSLTYQWPRWSKNNVLMYTAGKCPQIYQLDANLKDLKSVIKMSTGLHSYESPDFLNDNGDIVYAAALTRSFDQNLRPNCPTKVCDDKNKAFTDSSTLQQYCKDAVEKLLPKDNELFVSNKFGNIQKRLTKNNVYDGEVKVSPDGKYIVYNTYVNGDYELVRLRDDAGVRMFEQITNKTGFEFDVSFSSMDRNLIVYAATRPASYNQKYIYKRMALSYDFTNVAKSNIFVYSFNTQKEYQLTNLTGRAHSPMFVDDGKVVFVYEKDGDTWLHGVKFSTKANNDLLPQKPVEVDNFYSLSPYFVHKMSQKDGDSGKIVFAKQNNLYISNEFVPIFTNRLVDPPTTTTKTTIRTPAPKRATKKYQHGDDDNGNDDDSGEDNNDSGSNFAFKFVSFNLIGFLLILVKLI